MVSFKVSVEVNQPIELKTKLKLETDSLVLPFDDLLIETIPSDSTASNFQIRIACTHPEPFIAQLPTKLPSKKRPHRINSWWQKIFAPRSSQPSEQP